MASQPLPFEALQDRSFSFYPAVRGVEHNEWTLKEVTWSEVLVLNCQTLQELWIPRSHLGEVSSSDSPILILGLQRELELKAGGVYPYHKVVTELPSTRSGREQADSDKIPMPTQKRIRDSDARIIRMLPVAIGIGLLLSLTVFLGLSGNLRNPLKWLFEVNTTTSDQSYLALIESDNYHAVISKLSAPDSEQWISHEEDELQFQALHYASRGYIVVMMGGARAEMRYLGTVHDPSRQVLDSAKLSRGGNTSSMMHNLPEF